MCLSKVALLTCVACLIAGCDQKSKSTGGGGTTNKTPSAADKHDDHAGHDHEAGRNDKHSGAVVELGETTVDGMKIKASRDKGDIKAGGDSPIDIWVDGGLGGAMAVRFWIGTEDAKGSVKAKAEVEAGHWHTHAEVPSQLPPGSRLWVEVEGKNGKKSLASFDLKM